jgi:uncharacterized RDD family membrane protein YckC
MASAEYRVLTPERVALQYDIAGIGSRGAAAMVDTLIQAIALTVVFAALSGGTAVLGVSLSLGRGTATLFLGLVALAIFVITSGYFMLWEIVWNGQTPGKRLVGVRVIRENGYPIRPVDAVIRNLVRIVDWLPLFYGVGMLSMLLNPQSRRLGDFASGTIVVRERSSSIPLSATASPRGYGLSAADATLVRDFLMRRSTMDARVRADLARRIATAIAQRYALRLEDEPETFLEVLNL